MTTLIKGSVERFTITMEPYGESSLKKCDWYLKIITSNTLTIEKSQAIYIDDNTYDIIVDTNKTAVGDLSVLIYIDIIDNNNDKGVRRQVLMFDPSIRIIEEEVWNV